MKSYKLILDIGLGAVVPILILTYLSGRLGAVTAYLLAALIPVGWVAIDLLFVTRRFNFITSYVGLTAIINGILAFWFVDGLRFALKDSAAYVVATLLFTGSLVIGRPVMRYMFAQAQNPDTPEKQAGLDALLEEPDVHRAALLGTVLVVVQNLVMGAANFYLNLVNVTAAFGTDAFNQQVAAVNAITRVVFPLPSIAVLTVAVLLVFRAVYRHLPREGDRPQYESDFWHLVAQREHGGRLADADAGQ